MKKIDLVRTLALLVVIAAIVYFYLNIFAPKNIPGPIQVGLPRYPMTILFLGEDASYSAKTGAVLSDFPNRTDTIILAHIDPFKQRISLVSIPRDSYIEIKGKGPNKLNAAHVFGGIDLVIAEVEKLTGQKIDRFLVLNSAGFPEIVDLLGGVNVYVDKRMYYIDYSQNLKIDIKKGWQVLGGKQAQDFIRYRQDVLGDITRIERQQRMIKALAKLISRPDNLFKLPKVAGITQKYVKTDLSLREIVQLSNYLRVNGLDNLQIATMPGVLGEEEMAPYFLVDRDESKKFFTEFFNIR